MNLRSLIGFLIICITIDGSYTLTANVASSLWNLFKKTHGNHLIFIID